MENMGDFQISVPPKVTPSEKSIDEMIIDIAKGLYYTKTECSVVES